MKGFSFVISKLVKMEPGNNEYYLIWKKIKHLNLEKF